MSGLRSGARGGKAAEAGTEDEAPGASCPIHSFTGQTAVLLADGSSKPISEVKAADQGR
ncbi:MAG TPA: hypothetical protein VF444_11425 [Pseudonocardiaceae bacterium]